MASLTIKVDDSMLSRNINQRLAKLNDPSFREEINKYIASRLYDYVPKKSGELRRSMQVDAHGISWNTEYASYQFEGIKYGPNLIGFYSDGSVGWISKGSRHPTGLLGENLGDAYLTPQFGRQYAPDVDTIYWRFGYTTPGTRSRWADLYTQVGGDATSRAFRRSVNSEIARAVKKQLR